MLDYKWLYVYLFEKMFTQTKSIFSSRKGNALSRIGHLVLNEYNKKPIACCYF